jgi:Flp pilus assembly protein TadG
MRARNSKPALSLADDQGATAVEFAIVAPVVIMLIVGIPSLSLMLFAMGSLHFAVEDAARCASARPSQCADSAAIISYAQSRYSGVLATPVFTFVPAVPTSCGNQVTGTVTITFDVGMYRRPVALSATSCFAPFSDAA